MAFYRDGVFVSEDTSAPFQASMALVPGYHFFQVVATRPHGTTYTTSPLRVPVWAGMPTSAGGVTIPDNNAPGVTQEWAISDVPAGLKVIDSYCAELVSTPRDRIDRVALGTGIACGIGAIGTVSWLSRSVLSWVGWNYSVVTSGYVNFKDCC